LSNRAPHGEYVLLKKRQGTQVLLGPVHNGEGCAKAYTGSMVDESNPGTKASKKVMKMPTSEKEACVHVIENLHNPVKGPAESKGVECKGIIEATERIVIDARKERLTDKGKRAELNAGHADIAKQTSHLQADR